MRTHTYKHMAATYSVVSRTCVCICIYTYMYVCINIYTYTCIPTYMHTYALTHLYTRTAAGYFCGLSGQSRKAAEHFQHGHAAGEEAESRTRC